jgi:hypothetical protein
MRIAAVLAMAIGLLLAPSSTAGGDRTLEKGDGLEIRYPAGWRTIGHRLTNCVDPIEVIDLGGPGDALFMLQETGSRGLPGRPQRFRLVGKPSPLQCCTPTKQPGWLISFQDAGRGFYAYLYPGRFDRRDEVLAILNSLEVSPS